MRCQTVCICRWSHASLSCSMKGGEQGLTDGREGDVSGRGVRCMPSVGERISRESGIVSIPGRCCEPGNQHDSHAEGQNGALSILSHCLAHITAPSDSLREPGLKIWEKRDRTFMTAGASALTNRHSRHTPGTLQRGKALRRGRLAASACTHMLALADERQNMNCTL